MQTRRISVLYLASRPPFPVTGGREKIIAQGIEFLARDFDVHVVMFVRQGESLEVSRYAALGCKTLKIIPLPGVLAVARNVLMRKKFSLQENLFFSQEAQADILAMVSRGIDVVVADMLRTGQYCESLNIPKIIDLDDLLSNRYRQFLANGQKHTVFGTFSERVPKVFSRLEPYMRRLVLKSEAIRVERREREATKAFDFTLLTSELEAERLRRFSGRENVLSNPQAAQLAERAWHGPERNANVVPCFFLGNLKTSQNLSAVVYIVDHVIPRLVTQGFKPIVHLVGTFDERATKLFKLRDDVILHGFVVDYSTIADQCSLALMPITEGTGVKTKILEVMALGMPIVTTQKGVEGLSVVDTRELMIGSSADELARLTADIARDENLARELASAAKQYIALHHDPVVLMYRYCDVVQRSISNRRGMVAVQNPSLTEPQGSYSL